MDAWGTLLASAGISAVISAVVSLLTVHQATVKRARAERVDASRQAVRAAVQPLLDELARYQYVGRDEPRRTNAQTHMQDHANVVRIRRAAADQSALRRRLVDYRCRKVFGDYWTSLARDLPTAGNADDETGTFSAWLTSSLKDGRLPEGMGPLDGLLHRAYCEPPGHPLQAKLRRHLRRLALSR